MRGHGDSSGSFWYSLDLEEFVEREHPLRSVKRMVDEALRGMDADRTVSMTDRVNDLETLSFMKPRPAARP